MNTSPITHRTTLAAACAVLAAFSLGCAQPPPPPPPDTRAEDEAAIMQADAAWSQAAGSKQLDAIMSHVADDALMLEPNQATMQGKDAIRASWERLLALPELALSWKATRAVAAKSGDLGYSYGTYSLSMKDEKGNAISDNGKYLTVWAKQADGSWKVTADIFNTDIPLPAPPAK